ncbi:protein SPEAR3-like, partial [Phalaenopsis equestris]
MGSNQHEEFGVGGGRSASSSSRKTKKNSQAKQPKLPQRGLGVAQLEKIRIQSQMMATYNLQSLHHPFHSNPTMEEPITSSSLNGAANSVFSVHPNFLMSCGENIVSADTRFGGMQSSKARYLVPDHEVNSVPQGDHLQPVTRPLMM